MVMSRGHNMKRLFELVDEGLRGLEKTYFHYYVGNNSAAKECGTKTIKIFSQVLKLYSGLKDQSKDEIPITVETVKSLCENAIDLYTKIEKKKGGAEDRVKWLSSMINGQFYPPVVEYNDNAIVYVNRYDKEFDDKVEGLSANQQQYFDKWQHCSELDQESNWEVIQNIKNDLSNLYQENMLSTCSFVSSLISVSNNNPKLVFDSIFPHTKSFKYLVVLNVNGCKRVVFINDKLPVSIDSSITLFLKSFSNQHLYWPALLEKAYFKILGNNLYQFNGSNAGFDTYLLTGWIPEYVKPEEYFSHENHSESFWELIYAGFKAKQCLLCLGTGDNFPRAEQTLVANHDYAVIDLRIIEGEKQMLIQNPWLNEIRQTWFSYNYVINKFATIYINWNYELFDNCKQIRSLYTVKHDKPFLQQEGVFFDPQFSITNSNTADSEIWLFLSEDIANFQEAQLKKYMIKLTLARTSPGKLFSIKGSKMEHQTIETSNLVLLAKMTLRPHETITAIVEVQPKSDEKNVFPRKIIPMCLTCYSNSNILYTKARNCYKYIERAESEWNHESPGGNWLLCDYILNPQYLLDTSTDNKTDNSFTTVTLVAFIDDHDVLFNLQVFWYPDTGCRGIQRFDPKKIVYNEKYNAKGELVIPNLQLQRNKKYIILLSTYHPIAKLGLSSLPFKLIAASLLEVRLSKLRNVSTGLFSRRSTFSWQGQNRHKVYFKVHRRSQINIRIVSVSNGDLSFSSLSLNDQEYSDYRPRLRANVFSDKTNHAEYYNTQFDNNPYGVFINNLLLDQGTYVLLVERFEVGHGDVVVYIGGSASIDIIS